MGPVVDWKHADGRITSLCDGEWIGRSWRAALQLDDPRISEAHAMVSLRGDALVLLSLRGPLVVSGKRVDRVVLTPGLMVGLAPGVTLQVAAVTLPDVGFALTAGGMAETIIRGSVGLAPGPRVVHSGHRDASAWLWSAVAGWMLRDEGAETRIVVDEPFEAVGATWRLVERPLRGHAPTVASRRGAALRIVCRYESVHVFLGERAPVVLMGVQARIVCELAGFAVPVPWRILAHEVWPDADDGPRLRKRLDGALNRLRAALRGGGVRLNLVHPLGNGQIELLLYPDDVVVDEQ